MEIKEGLIKKKENIAVALSGGKDSMALVNFLFENSEKLGITVSAINVNHHIRGKESDLDTAFVLNYCEKKGIKCYSYDVNALEYSKNNKLSLEEGARILRYKVFKEHLSNKLCDKIATAHHTSDNTETVLFNLFRGSSIKGLRGIENANNIIRPFIGTSKYEIDEYISRNKIPFVTDSTNCDKKYTRNFLRLEIIPKIKEIFPSVDKSVYNLSLIAREDDDCLQRMADAKCFFSDGEAKLSIEKEKAIMNRMTVSALKYLGIKKDYEKKHADAVYNLVFAKSGTTIDLIGEVKATRDYDCITLYKKEPIKNTQYTFEIRDFDFGRYELKIEKVKEKTGEGLFIDRDKIPEGTVIRFRQSGDVFKKFGGFEKKLKDYFIDKKILQRRRDFIPLIAKDENILTVCGVEINDDLKVTDKTENIIKITLKEKAQCTKTQKKS